MSKIIKMNKKLKKNKPIKKSNIIDIGSSLINIKRKNSNEMLVLAPSELDYKPKKCKRCFYLEKNHKIGPKDFPPPVFSRFDVVQQAYYKDKNTSDLTKELPAGRIMNKDELPGRVVSETLTDNKGREFILGGRPDIVIKFDEGGYGIIDVTTTKTSDDKSENYQHQLEAYAQIFSSPGSTKTAKTPKLTYDQHPLVAVTDIQRWGFRGLNYHWGKFRNYTWEEIGGVLYVVRPSEIDDLKDISYAYFLTTL